MTNNEPVQGRDEPKDQRDPTLVEDNPVYGHRDADESGRPVARDDDRVRDDRERTDGGERDGRTDRESVPPDNTYQRPDSPGWAIGRTFLAVTRIALGFVMFWPFLDKLLGLGYSTPKNRAWINGGSPTKGFLSSVDVGPAGLQTFFHNIAGTWWADWAFMIGLAAIGGALILGIGVRIAAVANTVMMGMMWAAEWPLAKLTTGGDPSGSSNPIVDYHVIYALTGIVCAAFLAGRTLGLGLLWEKIVGRNRWLV